MKQSTSILRGMNHIRPEYILEGELPEYAAAPLCEEESFREKWQRVTASGWFTAAACAVCAILVMGGIIWAGQRDPSGPPAAVTIAPVGTDEIEADTPAEETTAVETTEEDTTEEDTTAAETTAEETTAEETTAETEPAYNLPDGLDFGGETIVIISHEELLSRGEIATDGLNGTLLNATVFERNKRVEEQFNVKISTVSFPTSDVVMDKVKSIAMSGEPRYDVAVGGAFTAYPYTLQSVFADLRSVPYVSLDQPWWIQGYNEAVRLGGMQFTATGSMLLSPYRSAMVTAFNKSLFDRKDQPYLYTYVQDHTWTLEKQTSLVPLLASLQDAKGNVYGFASSTLYADVDAYWSALDLDVIREETLELQIDESRIYTAGEELIYLFHGFGSAAYISEQNYWDKAQEELVALFSDGRAAMTTLQIISLENGFIRTMDDRYGFVPMPMLNSQQSGYYTYMDRDVDTVAIPIVITGARLKMVGAVVEAMSWEGHQVIRPSYEKSMLQTDDPDQRIMMDIIAGGLHTDLSCLDADFENHVLWALRNDIASGHNNMKPHATIMKKSIHKNLSSLQNKIEKLMEQYETESTPQ